MQIDNALIMQFPSNVMQEKYMIVPDLYNLELVAKSCMCSLGISNKQLNDCAMTT